MTTRQQRYTPRYIIGLCTLPFRIVGYFFNRMIWRYLIRKKSFIEWTVLVLSVTIVVLVVTGFLRGDFKAGKEPTDLSPTKRKHR